MKRIVEYAIQRKTDGRFEDVETFNARNCHWKEPIDDWLDILISDSYFWKRFSEKYRTARIVKRVTTEEVVLKNNFQPENRMGQ